MLREVFSSRDKKKTREEERCISLGGGAKVSA